MKNSDFIINLFIFFWIFKTNYNLFFKNYTIMNNFYFFLLCNNKNVRR